MPSRLILFAFLVCVPGAFADASKPAPTGRRIDVGGYRVHLFCSGLGAPTVVVAGGGFSFDWSLVQPKIAESTRVCTYDPSGTAWSDPPPASDLNCSGRVEELHRLLRSAPVDGPYVLVGYSIGGLFARLYASRYPKEVGGMVLVDHAFIDTGQPAAAASMSQADTPPVLISETPIVLGLEDDRNFQKLPRIDQNLHGWAMAAHPVRPTAEMAAECSATVANAKLGNMPLVVVSTRNDSTAYRDLQTKLLALSRDSHQMVAESSTHMVLVDQPEVIVSAVQQVIAEVRGPK